MKVQRYISENPLFLNATNMHEHTPLYEASHYSNIHIMRFLLQQGAKVNMKDNNGNTELYMAAIAGNAEACYLLIRHGANPNIANNNGLTPLYVAKQFAPELASSISTNLDWENTISICERKKTERATKRAILNERMIKAHIELDFQKKKSELKARKNKDRSNNFYLPELAKKPSIADEENTKSRSEEKISEPTEKPIIKANDSTEIIDNSQETTTIPTTPQFIAPQTENNEYLSNEPVKKLSPVIHLASADYSIARINWYMSQLRLDSALKETINSFITGVMTSDSSSYLLRLNTLEQVLSLLVDLPNQTTPFQLDATLNQLTRLRLDEQLRNNIKSFKNERLAAQQQSFNLMLVSLVFSATAGLILACTAIAPPFIPLFMPAILAVAIGCLVPFIFSAKVNTKVDNLSKLINEAARAKAEINSDTPRKNGIVSVQKNGLFNSRSQDFISKITEQDPLISGLNRKRNELCKLSSDQHDVAAVTPSAA